MATDLPSFFTKADFYSSLLPGYLALILYAVLFQPALLVVPTSQYEDLLSAIIFLIAGPTIGVVVLEMQRIVLFAAFRVRKPKATSPAARRANVTVRLKATTDELGFLAELQSEFDFNVSSGSILAGLFLAYSYSHWLPPHVVWFLVPGAATLFVAAYFSYESYKDAFTDLFAKYTAPAKAASVSPPAPATS
jgi:hypothetical protein